jgi:nucleoside-diphosphate-sugar epimerase
MNVLITGGAGFLGTQLAREILRRGHLHLAGIGETAVTSLTLADFATATPLSLATDGRVRRMTIDIGDPASLATALSPDTQVVFHLAAMVSGQGERDFDGCIRTNLEGTWHLLEVCRQTSRKPRVIFASSVAIYGGHSMTEIVSDRTKALPQTTYGVTKQIGELLVNEYSRKGFVDGRTARLPTVFIRPGQPNAAASSFASGLFREPLSGQPCHLPVARDLEMSLIGYRSVVANLITMAECDAALLGSDRAVILPSLRCKVGEMVSSLERYATANGLELGPIIDRPDEAITRIVKSWPAGTDATRVSGLALTADRSIEQVIGEYVEDFMKG